MLGPFIRSRVRGPRSEPVETGGRRRARNLLIDLTEILVSPFGIWRRRALELVTVELRIRGLEPAFDGYRIAFLTDLHASPLVPRWWLERAVTAANALRPDLVALGGDFIDDDHRYIEGLTNILRPLAAPDGVFGVLGNHDHYVDADAVRRAIEAAGVRELRNRHVLIERGAARLALAGVGELEMDVIDFAGAVGGVPEDVPRIVLSHDPDVFAYWPEALRLDLMISGHTHGGQAYLPVIGPPFVPSQFGARYLKGHFREGEQQLYVSRGIGASGVPFRWGCPPELTLIVLRPE